MRKNLPKPIGIMACYDIKAQQLLDVCRELDLAVAKTVITSAITLPLEVVQLLSCFLG